MRDAEHDHEHAIHEEVGDQHVRQGDEALPWTHSNTRPGSRLRTSLAILRFRRSHEMSYIVPGRAPRLNRRVDNFRCLGSGNRASRRRAGAPGWHD